MGELPSSETLLLCAEEEKGIDGRYEGESMDVSLWRYDDLNEYVKLKKMWAGGWMDRHPRQ